MDLLKYKHIIWDWNGTLLDDVNLCLEVINTLLVKRKLSMLTLEYYREIFSFPIIDYYEKLGFDFAQESFESIGTEFITDYEKKRNQCSLMSDAHKTLLHIAQLGLSQSILSASKQNYLEKAIGEYSLDATFFEINGLNNHYASSKIDIGIDFVTRNKFDPSTILLIGDTTHDADVAASIGADCCLIPNGHQSHKKLVDYGVPVVDSLSVLCQQDSIVQNNSLKINLRETYDKYAQDRESSVIQDWKHEERARFLSALQKEHKHKLLEIGAGTGRDSKFFQDQGFEVTCIDLSPAMIDLCSQKGLKALVMDMTKIDLPDHSFDAVYSMNSLLHLTKDEFSEVLLRINSLLQPDGIFYLGMYGGYDFAGVWEKDSYTPKRFFSFFTDEQLKEETSKVFETVSFNRVVFESENPNHFQSVMLRKRC